MKNQKLIYTVSKRQKFRKRVDSLIRKDRFCLESDIVHCGLRFLINKKWCQNITVGKNDCIAIMQFIQKPQKQANPTNMTMINAYASQTQHLKNDKIELLICIKN